MADIEAAVYSILTADSTLAALVGTRVYPNVVPQDVALPAVAYQRISTSRVYSHSPGVSQLARPRFQFTSVANSYSDVKAVANAVRGALDAYGGTAASVLVFTMLSQNEFDTFSDDGDLHTVRQDFYVWHREA